MAINFLLNVLDVLSFLYVLNISTIDIESI